MKKRRRVSSEDRGGEGLMVVMEIGGEAPGLY